MAFLDTIGGIISRRVLLNYRLDPDAVRRVLPAPFRPKLHDGFAIGGVCMIRFRELRPRPLPAACGLGSENAAHRIAVEWDQDGETREGVFIPRRDTNSFFNKALGGRVFPGIFDKSDFQVHESENHVSVRVVHDDGREEFAFEGRIGTSLRPGSVFADVEEASRFFKSGATGYSATHTPGHYHGMELHCNRWHVEPVDIEVARSSFYGDPARFPPGTAELDCALIMRDIEHQWQSRPDLYHGDSGTELTTNRPTGR